MEQEIRVLLDAIDKLKAENAELEQQLAIAGTEVPVLTLNDGTSRMPSLGFGTFSSSS